MDKVYTSLSEVLNLPASEATSNSYHFKGQILITLTTIFIELSVIRSQPQKFEVFVELLLDTISRVNVGPDRMLRETVIVHSHFFLIFLGLSMFART
jgi:hypothetical protein